MAPIYSRQLFMWTLPTVAVLFSYFWFRKKRIGLRSDPGEIITPTSDQKVPIREKHLEENFSEVTETEFVQSTPKKNFSRSLSGVESAPIDIILARPLLIVSDEELDFQIEKIKSMKNESLFSNKSDTSRKMAPTPFKVNNESATAAPLKKQNESNEKKKEDKKVNGYIQNCEDKENVDENSNSSDHNLSQANLNNSNQKNTLELNGQSERDSANHSPCDGITESPSTSSMSDNHSEGYDSGQGCSDAATPPPSTGPNQYEPFYYYEFEIPQKLVGVLIGKHGYFISQILRKTRASVYTTDHPSDPNLSLAIIQGSYTSINLAMDMIRNKFPKSKLPAIYLEPGQELPVIPFPMIDSVPFFHPFIPTQHDDTIFYNLPDNCYVRLVEGVNNDTILSTLMTPLHLFLQQPTHPSYPSLQALTSSLNAFYSQTDFPLLPSPISPSTLCVAMSMGRWFRAQVIYSDPNGTTSVVRDLDWGSDYTIDNTDLRQINAEFLKLNFQAAECFLANLKAPTEDKQWTQEEIDHVIDMCRSVMITQIMDFTPDGIPLVDIYILVGSSKALCLNKYLVEIGMAAWIKPPVETVKGETAEGEAVQSEPTQGSPTQGSPTQDTPTQGSPTQDTPTQDTPTQGSPTQEEYAQGSPAQNEADSEEAERL